MFSQTCQVLEPDQITDDRVTPLYLRVMDKFVVDQAMQYETLATKKWPQIRK